MVKTFGEVVTEVARLSGDENNQNRIAAIRDSVNRRYKEVIRARLWPDLITESEVTVEAGDGSLGLPSRCERIIRIYDTAQGRVLQSLEDSELTQRFADRVNTSGSPGFYSRIGTFGVKRQPATPINLILTSTVSADVFSARIWGYDANGDPVEEEKNGVGVTSQVFSTVIGFTKDQDTVGSVKIADTTTYGIIAPKERRAMYPWVRFDVKSDAQRVFRVTHTIRVPDVLDDNDYLLMDCDHVLVAGAHADILKNHRQFNQSRVEETRFASMLMDYIESKMGETTVRSFMPEVRERF